MSITSFSNFPPFNLFDTGTLELDSLDSNPAPKHVGYRSCGKLINPSEPQFSHPEMKLIMLLFIRLL